MMVLSYTLRSFFTSLQVFHRMADAAGTVDKRNETGRTLTVEMDEY